MWNRACPLCFTKVPRFLVMTRSDDLSCPSCRAQLELSRPSRVLGALTGLIAAFVASYLILFETARGQWFLSMVGALLAYALGSVLALFFLSDVVVQPKPPHQHFPQTQA
jgi:hypothetical protein